jgi:hypothetical protein
MIVEYTMWQIFGWTTSPRASPHGILKGCRIPARGCEPMGKGHMMRGIPKE